MVSERCCQRRICTEAAASEFTVVRTSQHGMHAHIGTSLLRTNTHTCMHATHVIGTVSGTSCSELLTKKKKRATTSVRVDHCDCPACIDIRVHGATWLLCMVFCSRCLESRVHDWARPNNCRRLHACGCVCQSAWSWSAVRRRRPSSRRTMSTVIFCFQCDKSCPNNNDAMCACGSVNDNSTASRFSVRLPPL